MSNLWAIAKITFIEGVRSRFFYGLFLVALLLFSTAYALSNLFPRDVVKVAVDLSLGTASLVGLILTLFWGTELLSKDLEKRTIHMVLAKAVSRSEYIVGKFAGLAVLIGVSMLLLALFASLAVWTVDVLTDDQYGVIHWPVFLLSLAMTTLMCWLVASVIFFFSSFVSSTFLALGLTLVVYLIGQSVEEIRQLIQANTEGIEISPVFTAIVAVAYYVFPNLAVFNFKTQAAHGLPVSASTVIWSALYGTLYTSVMIASSAWLFRRREFP